MLELTDSSYCTPQPKFAKSYYIVQHFKLLTVTALSNWSLLTVQYIVQLELALTVTALHFPVGMELANSYYIVQLELANSTVHCPVGACFNS